MQLVLAGMPVPDEYVPGGHSRQVPDETAPLAEEYRPIPHALHVDEREAPAVPE